MKIASLSLCCGLAAACCVSVAQAASGDNPLLNEAFTFRLGGGYLDGSIKATSDINGGSAAGEIDLGELGVDGNTLSPYFNARWRFAESWQATFEYFGWDDSGMGSAQGDIVFGDITIPAGVQARADFDVDIYAVTLGWSFIKSAEAELGIGLGLHVADVRTSITGSGFIGNVAAASVSESVTATAPLPNVRLYGSYASHWKRVLDTSA